MNMRIEIDNDEIVMILPRVMEDWALPWQDAWELGAVLEEAARQIPVKLLIADSIKTSMNQVKVTDYHGLVVLLFQHVDRVRLSRDASIFLGRKIRSMAQNMRHQKQLGGKKLPGS